ncbi:hypothetical protein [Rickettsiella endosymbiont of Dermanyssus gallinae]|uniref:hypothetical protein n=1 Tax=Rickettsiella endosymbiont of Dermanyssus gallinae TaxID=2856608 RepID=UPI001C5321FA|nr:hypothetical protein [Rickettsiella endosymbiont of Dermanyssus gallinae]
MCRRFFPAIIIIIAIIMAFAASVAKPDSVDYIVMTSRFFDIMLPVLAVGALIKYLCCHRGKSCKCPCEHCKQCGCKS